MQGFSAPSNRKARGPGIDRIVLCCVIGLALFGTRLIWGAVNPSAAALHQPSSRSAAEFDLAKASSPPEPGAAVRTKNIEDVAEGDIVWAKDERTGEMAPKRVVRTFRRISDHLRIVRLASSDGQEQEIRTTDEHPFYVDQVGWVPAGKLEAGKRAIQANGQIAVVLRTEYEAHPRGILVHNIEVQNAHTYFVTQSSEFEPILVHNACEWDPRAGRWRDLDTGRFARGADALKGRPTNLKQKLALEEARAGGGRKIMDNLNDPKFSGMEKWQLVHHSADGSTIVIHYVRDPATGALMDFKFLE